MRNQIVYKSWTWDDDNITYTRLNKEVSLPVSSLAIDTLQGEVVCDDPAILDFQQNDPLLVFHRGKQTGFFYLQGVTRTGPDRYQIEGISPVGRLAQMEHRGGKYDNVPLAQVVSSICGDVPFIIKSNLINLKISGLLEYAKPTGEGSNDRSARDNLAQVLFAIGANLGTDNNGVLRIQNLWDGLSSYIDDDRVYRQGAAVRSDPPYTSVTVVEHQWVEGGDETTLFDGTATAGQVVTFPGPMYDLTATGLTIRESGANYAVLEAGTGTLTGREYIHLTRDVTRAVSDTGATNVKRIAEATLVTLLNSAAVAARLADYYAHRTTISEDVIMDREHPCQVIALWDPFDRVMRSVCLGSAMENYSAVVKASIEALVGFLPPQAENQEYFDFRVVLTGSGVWTVPEGVSQITVVLIGGGSGAQPGSAGEAAPAPPQRTWTGHFTESTSAYKGYGFNSSGQEDDSIKAGEGGAPGQAGEGGKILRLDLTVTPGQTFAFSCGPGGLGIQFGTSEEHPGGDTSFGEYSSSNGTRSPLGFTDPITGDIYGATGAEGIPGGRGACPSEETPPGVTADGQTWNPGSHPPEDRTGGQGSWQQQYGYLGYTIHASYGGGAAYGAHGFDGSNTGAVKYFRHVNEDNYYLMYVFAAVRAGGATALPPPKATTIGTGGTAGNGGGGEGAIGLTFGDCTTKTGVQAGTVTPFYNAGSGQPTPLGPGDGSAGGEGGDGGILIYYRVLREQIQAGLFVEQRQKRFLVDKTGRQIIT